MKCLVFISKRFLLSHTRFVAENTASLKRNFEPFFRQFASRTAVKTPQNEFKRANLRANYRTVALIRHCLLRVHLLIAIEGKLVANALEASLASYLRLFDEHRMQFTHVILKRTGNF